MFFSVHGLSEQVKQIVICRNERKCSSVAIMVLQMPNFLHVKLFFTRTLGIISKEFGRVSHIFEHMSWSLEDSSSGL